MDNQQIPDMDASVVFPLGITIGEYYEAKRLGDIPEWKSLIEDLYFRTYEIEQDEWPAPSDKCPYTQEQIAASMGEAAGLIFRCGLQMGELLAMAQRIETHRGPPEVAWRMFLRIQVIATECELDSEFRSAVVALSSYLIHMLQCDEANEYADHEKGILGETGRLLIQQAFDEAPRQLRLVSWVSQTIGQLDFTNFAIANYSEEMLANATMVSRFDSGIENRARECLADYPYLVRDLKEAHRLLAASNPHAAGRILSPLIEQIVKIRAGIARHQEAATNFLLERWKKIGNSCDRQFANLASYLYHDLRCLDAHQAAGWAMSDAMLFFVGVQSLISMTLKPTDISLWDRILAGQRNHREEGKER